MGLHREGLEKYPRNGSFHLPDGVLQEYQMRHETAVMNRIAML